MRKKYVVTIVVLSLIGVVFASLSMIRHLDEEDKTQLEQKRLLLIEKKPTVNKYVFKYPYKSEWETCKENSECEVVPYICGFSSVNRLNLQAFEQHRRGIGIFECGRPNAIYKRRAVCRKEQCQMIETFVKKLPSVKFDPGQGSILGM
ncbi:MAG: hypothetical protein EOP04_09070 [Proteobacteria bacterium]|nr:MAG: hypothetical protein EOP04_09070 [Pseudomonadota bacterium]